MIHTMEEKERFEITNDAAAMWAARKISEAERDKAALKAHYDTQYKKACAELDGKIDYMRGLLRGYYESLPDAVKRVTKTQSKYTLPGLEMVYKPKSASYTPDKDALLAFCKADDALAQYIKVTESADWAGIKKISEDMEGEDGVVYRVLKETGEVLPVSVVVEDVFSVKVSGEEAAGNE